MFLENKWNKTKRNIADNGGEKTQITKYKLDRVEIEECIVYCVFGSGTLEVVKRFVE